MRHHLTILAALCCAASTPAAAQFFRAPPSQRTIVLSPGWHIQGPPVRSAAGLRFAVRSDNGVVKDMTVTPNGAIRFSAQEPAPRKTVRRPHKSHALASRNVHPQLPAAAAKAAEEEAAKDVTVKSKQEKDTVSAKPVTTAAAVIPEPAAAPMPPVKPVPAPAPAPTPPRTGPGYAHGVPINPLD